MARSLAGRERSPMRWLVAAVAAVCLAGGCRGQAPPGPDPFFGATTVPPPGTGACCPRPGAAPYAPPYSPPTYQAPGTAAPSGPTYPPSYTAPGYQGAQPAPYSPPPFNSNPSAAPPASYAPAGGFSTGGAGNFNGVPGTYPGTTNGYPGGGAAPPANVSPYHRSASPASAAPAPGYNSSTGAGFQASAGPRGFDPAVDDPPPSARLASRIRILEPPTNAARPGLFERWAQRSGVSAEPAPSSTPNNGSGRTSSNGWIASNGPSAAGRTDPPLFVGEAANGAAILAGRPRLVGTLSARPATEMLSSNQGTFVWTPSDGPTATSWRSSDIMDTSPVRR